MIMLRMTRFAMGGPCARKEAQRMVATKVQSDAEPPMLMTAGTVGASPLSGGRKATSNHQRKMNANRKQLSRAKG